MRYLEFSQITIDQQNQLLIRQGEVFTLAPKVYDLLLYFCQNQQRVISKDELMENVWQGTLVTENAISRTLVKVRKALGDDPKEPNFIVTVPRKGYRMVADFQAVEKANPLNVAITDELLEPNTRAQHVASESAPASITQNKSKASLVKSAFLLVCVICLAVFGYYKSQEVKAITTKQIKPLTRDIDVEQYPSLSFDQQQLTYTKTQSGKPRFIVIEDLLTGKKVSVRDAKAQLTRSVWSPNGKQLAFLYQTDEVCQIYLAPVNTIKQQDTWRSVSECGLNSWPHFVFSPSGDQLYFNDRQSTTNGYQIFRVDLANGQKEIINQPITSGQGNYAFDLSPNGKQLVMLNSEFSPQTRLYTLDIESTKLTKTAQLPYLMRSVIWHHDDQTIIHPSPHPAYEIWQSNLAGEKLAVVASNTLRVKQLSRVNNGKDFNFVSYLLNRDLYFKAHGDNQTQWLTQLDNSSVMDYLPAIANSSDQYAFVSKRSTTSEVYLANLPKKGEHRSASKRLTFFNNPVKLFQLMFSPDDRQLMIVADNQIYLADIAGDKVIELPINNMAINGASWRDDKTILFSTVRNNSWQVMEYRIDNQELKTLSNDYLGGVYLLNQQQYYFINRDFQVVSMNQLDQTQQVTPLNCSTAFINRQLNLKVTHQGLVCWSSNGNGKSTLRHLNFADGSVSDWHQLPTSFDYQVNHLGIIHERLAESVADLMQTTTH